MTVIGSGVLQDAQPLSDQRAAEDIVERNSAGQNVVVVPQGQRIPTRLLEAHSKAVRPADVEDKAVKKPARRNAKRSEE